MNADAKYRLKVRIVLYTFIALLGLFAWIGQWIDDIIIDGHIERDEPNRRMILPTPGLLNVKFSDPPGMPGEIINDMSYWNWDVTWDASPFGSGKPKLIPPIVPIPTAPFFFVPWGW